MAASFSFKTVAAQTLLMAQIISTWLFQPYAHKLRKFLSSDRGGPSAGAIQSLNYSAVLNFRASVDWMWWHYKKWVCGAGERGREGRDFMIWDREFGGFSVPPLSASPRRARRREAPVNQQRPAKKAFIKHKCVTRLMQNKCLPCFHQRWRIKEAAWPWGLPHKLSTARWRWATSRDDMLRWGLKTR